jgi:biotin carboxylase
MKKIAILGASKPHLPLYLRAKEMGLEVHCVAWAEGAYCKDYADFFHDISITDKEAVARLCVEEGIDGVISNALEPAVPTMAYLHDVCGLNGISSLTAARCTDKKLMRQCIKDNDACPQPKFSLLDQTDPSQLTYPVIVKPTDSSCSNGVTKVCSPDEFAAAVERASSASKNGEILIEECIEGEEISVESISFKGKHYILTVTDKETTGAPYFVETAHHQPSAKSPQILEQLKEYVIRIHDALGIDNGASHAEFKITEDGRIYFIEIGARGGGDFISYELVRLSTGYDYVKGMIEVALGEFTEPVIETGRYSGVYFLSKETEDLKDFIQKNEGQDWVYDAHIDDGPLKSLRKSQDRSGWIIYSSDHKIEKQ